MLLQETDEWKEEFAEEVFSAIRRFDEEWAAAMVTMTSSVQRRRKTAAEVQQPRQKHPRKAGEGLTFVFVNC